MKRLFTSLVAASLLLLPAFATAAPRERAAEHGGKTHIVAPGHTLAKIAKRYHVSIQELREINNLPSGPLKLGTRILIPTDSLQSEGAKTLSHAKKGEKGVHAGKHGQEEDDRDREEEEAPRKNKKHKKAQPEQEEERSSTVEEGHLKLIRGDKSWEGKVVRGKGKVSPAASKAIQRILAPEKGKGHSIDRRLVLLLVKISDHFGGRPIEIVSGFRSGKANAHLKHGSGAAVDLRIPGVRNEEVRNFARSLENVGVGYFPNGGFLHLDVRSPSFSWTDPSKPKESAQFAHDEPSKEDSMDGKEKGNSKKKVKDSAKKEPR